MNLKHFKMFSDKGFQDVNDACSSEKMYMNSHEKFQERLRKTLYYGNFADATLPSPIVTDVAVRLINAKTNSKKSLDKHQAARITRRARISPCALMMGILYTERLAQTNPNYLKKVSSSDLFMVSMKIYAETHVQLHKVASLNLCVNPGLTCFEQPAPGVVNLSGIKESYNVLVASKYLYDDGEDEDAYNYDWCKAGNYHIHDLNRLEREFLNSIEWKVFVSCKEFFDFVNKVETRVALDQSDERGWFTYLDMSTILENSIFQDFFTKYLKSTGKTILGCTLAYSLSLVLLLSFPVYLSNKEHVVCQDAPSVVGKSIPSMSFTGQLGYSEYSLKISQSVRKRQMILGNSSDFKQQNYWSTLKLNETKPTNGGYTEDICEHCRSNRMTLDSKGSFLANWFSSTTGECSGQTCGSIVNDTIDAQKLVTNFKQILSFMTLAFYTRSSVRFPVWENRYSDIWIGFSTSCASAAA